MPRSPESYYTPPAPAEYRSHLRAVTPPLDPTRLSTQLLRGGDRRNLGLPVTGDWSLAVGYRKSQDTPPKAGFVASAGETDSDLSILQLQGASGKIGFRVAKGLDVTLFVAREIDRIATHPDSPYDRIVMPPPTGIEGLEEVRTDSAASRYEQLARSLGLNLSREEGILVRDLKK